jgi:hypothetical protein
MGAVSKQQYEKETKKNNEIHHQLSKPINGRLRIILLLHSQLLK